MASGKLSADEVAQAVVAAVKEDRFYILTHPRIKGAIQARMEDILKARAAERAPRDPLQRFRLARGTARFRPSAMVWMAMRGEQQAEQARGDVEAGGAHARLPMRVGARAARSR